MKQRPVVFATDADGMPYVRAPVAKTGKEVILDAETWNKLITLGYSGNIYSMYFKGNDTHYPMLCAPKPDDQNLRKSVLLGRVITNALVDEKVYYKDGNPLNCRMSNLILKPKRKG